MQPARSRWQCGAHALHHTPHAHIMSSRDGGSDASGAGGSSAGRGSGSTGQLQIGSFLAPAGESDPSQERRQEAVADHVNPQAKNLRFPDNVPAAVRKAIETYTPPTGFSIAEISSAARTPIMFWGVRLDIDDAAVGTGSSRPQEWACLANHKCRSIKKRLKITSSQTSGATTHLSTTHKLESPVSAATRKRCVCCVGSVGSVGVCVCWLLTKVSCMFFFFCVPKQ